MPTRSASAKTSPYTKPALRERIKAKLMKSDQGGRPGQWSARKSQLLAAGYRNAGGGYRGKKTAKQKELDKWTSEEWQTKSGQTRARRGKTTARYLPKKAWARLTETEQTATDRKKKTASRTGRQFVANTTAATKARRASRK